MLSAILHVFSHVLVKNRTFDFVIVFLNVDDNPPIQPNVFNTSNHPSTLLSLALAASLEIFLRFVPFPWSNPVRLTSSSSTPTTLLSIGPHFSPESRVLSIRNEPRSPWSRRREVQERIRYSVCSSRYCCRPCADRDWRHGGMFTS